jgi:hypothetical protein
MAGPGHVDLQREIRDVALGETRAHIEFEP